MTFIKSNITCFFDEGQSPNGLNGHEKCHCSWEWAIKFVIDLVCGIIPEIPSSPETSEVPDHDGDKTDQQDKEDDNVNNG